MNSYYDFVPKYFQMNPETDDLILGQDLRVDMIVLLEDDDWRVYIDNPAELPTEGIMAVAKKYNRWCLIRKIFKLSGKNKRNILIGQFCDGTKATFTYGDLSGWYVKKDSMVATVGSHDLPNRMYICNVGRDDDEVLDAIDTVNND